MYLRNAVALLPILVPLISYADQCPQGYTKMSDQCCKYQGKLTCVEVIPSSNETVVIDGGGQYGGGEVIYKNPEHEALKDKLDKENLYIQKEINNKLRQRAL